MNTLDLMENIRPEFIEEAEDFKPKKKKRIIYPAALAACACIVLLTALPVLKNGRPFTADVPPAENAETETPATAPVESEEPAVSPETAETPIEITPVTDGASPSADTSLLDWGFPADGDHVPLSDIHVEKIGGGVTKYSDYAMSFDAMFSGIKDETLNAGDTLPVFKSTYQFISMFRDPELVTDEVRDRVLKELDAFVSLTGLPAKPSEFVTTSYDLNDPERKLDPLAKNYMNGCTVYSRLSAFTASGLKVDISQENWLVTALSENAVLKTALSLCGITEPHITYQNSYPFFYYDFENRSSSHRDVEQNYRRRSIYITQDSGSYRDYMAGSVFSCIEISFTEYEGSTEAELFMRIEKPTDYTYCGEYEAVTYEEAVSQFCAETGYSESDIVGSYLTYRNYEAEDYFVPAYIFYYVSPYQSDNDSGTNFDGYAVRAVRD